MSNAINESGAMSMLREMARILAKKIDTDGLLMAEDYATRAVAVIRRLEKERVDLTDKILKQEAIIEEMGGAVTTAMLRQGILATHEDCPKCGTRGFENGVACEECGGVGRRKLDKQVRQRSEP